MGPQGQWWWGVVMRTILRLALFPLPCVQVGRLSERHRMVPLPPRVWVLAVGHRRGHSDAEPEVPRALPGRRHRPHADSLCRKGKQHSVL